MSRQQFDRKGKFFYSLASMSSWIRSITLVLTGAFSLGLFISLWRDARHFTIVNHTPDLSWPALFLFFLLALAIIIFFWLSSSGLIWLLSRNNFSAIIRHNSISLLPFILCSLAPLTLKHFLTGQDLSKRLSLYLLLVIIFFFWIMVLLFKEVAPESVLKEKCPVFFRALSPRQKSALLFLAALIIFSLGGFILQLRGANFSGDEPHYLIIAHSLLVDHDFDLANNYEQRDYQQYLGPGIIIEPHTVPGARAGSRLSFHSPGVSFLILPFYWLGRLLGGSALVFFPRLGLSLWGALFCWQIFLFFKEKGWGEKLALKLWAISALTSPLFFYSFHLYPEIVIACLSLGIFRWLNKPAGLKSHELALSGIFLSLFLWFHSIKYIFIIVPFFIYALLKILKTSGQLKIFILFLIPFLAGVTGYLTFQQILYGSFNPTSVSWQGAMGSQESLAFLKFVFLSIPFRFRWETLAGYFLDQRDGLLLYAPIYFFAFVGLLTMLRQKKKLAWSIIFLTWPYFLFSAFLTQRSGYAPQARPLVASFWGFSIFLGYFLATNRKKYLSFLASGAFIYSLIITLLLLLSPLNLYQETTAGTTDRSGGLFLLLSHLHFSLPVILPSFLKIEGSFWWPNYIWLGLFFLCLAFSQLGFDLKFRFSFAFKVFFILAALAFLLFWFTYYPRLVLTHPVKKRWPENQIITFYSLSRVAQLKMPGTFLLPQANRPYHFWFQASTRFEGIEIEMSSPSGKIPVELLAFDYPFFQGAVDSSRRKIELSEPPFYRLGKNFLYWLTINLGPEEEGKLRARPFEFFFSLK